MSPHRPARLLLRGDARRAALRKIVRPARVSARLPRGPSNNPPSYESVASVVELICDRPLADPLDNEEALINTAMVDWYAAARTECSEIAGIDFSFKQTTFRMEPAAAKTASPWAGESATSAFWRSLASRAKDTANLIARPSSDNLQRKTILSHMRTANRAILLVPNR